MARAAAAAAVEDIAERRKNKAYTIVNVYTLQLDQWKLLGRLKGFLVFHREI